MAGRCPVHGDGWSAGWLAILHESLSRERQGKDKGSKKVSSLKRAYACMQSCRRAPVNPGM